jgi:hypothetical protein
LQDFLVNAAEFIAHVVGKDNFQQRFHVVSFVIQNLESIGSFGILRFTAGFADSIR